MKRSPCLLQRHPRQVRQRARAPMDGHGTRVKRYGHGVSKPQPPTCRGVSKKKRRLPAWGAARPASSSKTTTPSPPVRVCSVGGQPVLHGAKRAGPCGTAFESYSHEDSKPQPPIWRGCVEVLKWSPRPTAWGGARSALAAKISTSSPPARASSVGGPLVLHRAKRARTARHGSQALWVRRF